MHRQRFGAAGLVALLVGLLTLPACDQITGNNDNTEQQHDADLVGSWVAVSAVITDATNATRHVDIISDLGGFMHVTFDADGTVALNEWDGDAGRMEDDGGTWFTTGTSLVIDWDSEPGPDTVGYQIVSGHVVVDVGEEDVDFDGDGIDEVGNMVMTFVDVAESPEAGLVGTWTATSMSYAWDARPDSTIDVIALGGSFQLVANGDGTYAVTIGYPGGGGENESGVYTALEGLLWVYDTGSANPEMALLTYTVSGGSATLVRPEEEAIDFDGDGVDDPATLTITLVKQ